MKLDYNKEELEGLKLEFAFIPNKPITTPNQLIKEKEIVVSEIDEIVEELIDEHLKKALSSGADIELCKSLESKLCSFDGEALCYCLDNYAKLILDEGQIWYGDVIYHEEMVMGQCHNNSIIFNNENPECPVVVGYALSEHGFWYSHTWLLAKDSDGVFVVETTKPAELYYGVVLTEQLLEDFKNCYSKKAL